MSWPDCDWASAAIFAGIWRCAIVSTRTSQFASLPKASACLRSSSSEAGTKWFHERNVSSRFCAYAGARSTLNQAAATADVLRNWRRLVSGPIEYAPFVSPNPGANAEASDIFYCRRSLLVKHGSPACQDAPAAWRWPILARVDDPRPRRHHRWRHRRLQRRLSPRQARVARRRPARAQAAHERHDLARRRAHRPPPRLADHGGARPLQRRAVRAARGRDRREHELGARGEAPRRPPRPAPDAVSP